MEIKITNKLKKLDSSLIRHLISLCDEEEKTITINKKYKDIYNIIKKNKTIFVDFKNIKYTNYILEGLAYFGNKKIFEDILKKLAKYIKEKYIDRKSVERFFEKYPFEDTEANRQSLSGNINLSEAFFERYINSGRMNLINWNSLCKNTNISEKFFEKYISKGVIDWDSICQNTNISEAFFEKYINNINQYGWWYLSINTNLSEAFFEKYINKIDWGFLCLNNNISEAFFEKYINSEKMNLIKWYSLCANTNISEKFFEKYIDKVDWNVLCENFNISEKFFERHINQELSNKIDWISLCANTNMSEKFFEKYIDKIQWYCVYKNTNLSEEFYQKHIDKIKLDFFINYRELSIEFFEKNIDKIKNYCSRNLIFTFPTPNATNPHWSLFCKKSNLTEQYIDKNIEFIDWNFLCQNNNISEKIFEKYISKGFVNWYWLYLNTFRANHSRDKIILWLKKNPQYSFDNLICKFFT